MSETSAPWRALEDGPVTAPGSGTAAPSGGSGKTSSERRSVGSWWIAGALGLAAVLVAGAVFLVLSGGQGSVAIDGDGTLVGGSSIEPRSPSSISGGAGGVVVDVQGAVLRPGVVHLQAGARVADAISAAGGYGPRVAVERVGQMLNLAAEVHDGDQVVVPSRDDPGVVASVAPGGGGAGTGGAGGGTGGPVDLNHATASELDTLPGIGPVTAAKIIAARDEQPFASLDDLRTRKVLGAAALEKIKDLVVVR
jgi:competence protein ComEA